MPSSGSHEPVSDQLRFLFGGEQVESVDVRLDRSESLEVGVEVHAAMRVKDLVSGEIRSETPDETGRDDLRRSVIERLVTEPRKVVLRPEGHLPAGILFEPGAAETIELGWDSGAEPDPMEVSRDEERHLGSVAENASSSLASTFRSEDPLSILGVFGDVRLHFGDGVLSRIEPGYYSGGYVLE